MKFCTQFRKGWIKSTCIVLFYVFLWQNRRRHIMWGAMAKPGGAGQSASVRNIQKINGVDIFLSFCFFNLLIFVIFHTFTIHILRHRYKKQKQKKKNTEQIQIFLKWFKTGSHFGFQSVTSTSLFRLFLMNLFFGHVHTSKCKLQITISWEPNVLLTWHKQDWWKNFISILCKKTSNN